MQIFHSLGCVNFLFFYCWNPSSMDNLCSGGFCPEDLHKLATALNMGQTLKNLLIWKITFATTTSKSWSQPITYVDVHDVYGDVGLVAGRADELRVCHHHVLDLPPRHGKGIKAPDGLPAKDVEVVRATTEEVATLRMEWYRSGKIDRGK